MQGGWSPKEINSLLIAANQFTPETLHEGDRMHWNDELDAILTEHFNQGKYASESAKILGVTKNSVIGRRHRLGLGKFSQPRTPRKRVRGLNKLTRLIFQDRPEKPKIETPEYSNPVRFMSLNERTCRWPLSGEGLNIWFCGAQPERELPYCKSHCKTAYNSDFKSDKPKRVGNLQWA